MAENDVTSYFKSQRQQKEALAQFENMRAKEFDRIQAKINKDTILTQKEKNRLLKQEKEEFDKITAQQRAHLIQLLEENKYRNSSVNEMLRMKQAQAESLNLAIAQKEALKATITDKAQLVELETSLNSLKANKASLDNDILKFNRAITAAEFENVSLAQKMGFIENKTQQAFEKYKQSKLDLNKKVKAGLLTQDEADAELKKQTGAAFSNITGNNTIDNFMSKQAEGLSKQLAILKQINDSLTTINNSMDQYVDKAMGIITTYMGKIDGRLQGTDQNFTNINSLITKQFAGNAYVSQSKLIENVAKLTESGIAYNVEERALLMSVSDKIVETFDVLDSTLTRLTRIQQADMTESFMGVEARLLQDFNSLFSDSSYLNDMYDSISSAIVDASSQMTLDQATAFNYSVQKWLGSLYSLGMSSSGVSQIAQGLNYLATGDVNSLASNSSLQTLFALSAKNAGMSYADLLTGGLDANSVNNLMKSMVEYLQDIVNNTSNQVTKSAWGNITNFTLSDLRAIQNLTNTDIAQIYNKNMNYTSAINELNYQLEALDSRYSSSEKISNILENLTYTAGMNIADNEFSYAAWKVGDLFKEYFNSGGFSSTLANLIQSPLSITSIIKSILGTNLIGNIKNSVIGDTNLDTAFLWDKYMSTSRGEMLSANSANSIFNGISQSGSVVMTNMGTTIQSGTPLYTLETGATNTSMSATSVMNSSEGIIRDVSDVYARLFEDQSTPLNIKVEYFEDRALEQLEKYLRGKELEAIYNQVQYGSVPVHDTEYSGSSITDTLSLAQR